MRAAVFLSMFATACGGDAVVAADAAVADAVLDQTDDVPLLPQYDAPACAFSECPRDVPMAGAPCATGGTCEYGVDRNPWCNVRAHCVFSSWQVAQASGGGCQELDAAASPACASTYAQVPRGATCPSIGLACDFPEGRCVCALRDAGAGSWICDDVDGTGCPTQRPRLGAACAVDGAICRYGGLCGDVVAGGAVIECLCGSWTTTCTGPCVCTE